MSFKALGQGSFAFRNTLMVAAMAVIALVDARAQSPIAPAKIAIVNLQKAVADTQEIKKAQAALQAKYGPRTQEIQSLQNDLQSLQNQLNTPNLPPDREASLRDDFTHKQRELQRMQEDLQTDIDRERQDILGRAGRQMQQIIQSLAQQRGVDVVIDVSNTLYYKPMLDMTAEATAAYDKAYPPK